ncbi:hypothetical protein D3C78_685740 [compost metagenome]
MHFVYLFSMLATVIGPLVIKVLKILGFGMATYVGFNVAIDAAKDALLAKFGVVDTTVQQLLGLAQFDVAINIMFSAIATRAIMAGLSSTDKIGRLKILTKDGMG